MSYRTETEKPPNRGQPIPSNAAKCVHKSAKPRVVNVSKNSPTKIPSQWLKKIAVYTSGETESLKTANQHRDCGYAQIMSPKRLALK